MLFLLLKYIRFYLGELHYDIVKQSHQHQKQRQLERTRETCYFSRQGSLLSQNPPPLGVGSMSIETVRYCHCRPNKLNIDLELKKGRRGAGEIASIETEVQAVFLKTFTHQSNRRIAKMLGIAHHWTITEIERRNKTLKNLFEEYRVQIGNDYGTHLKESIEFILQGMDKSC